jgi:hypothetical protein
MGSIGTQGGGPNVAQLRPSHAPLEEACQERVVPL